MSEVLAQLKQKGGGGKYFYADQAVSNNTRYNFDCGFRPDYVYARFYNGSNRANMSFMVDATQTQNGIWKVGSSSDIYGGTIGTDRGITDNGFWITSDDGSMTGRLEVRAFKE